MTRARSFSSRSLTVVSVMPNEKHLDDSSSQFLDVKERLELPLPSPVSASSPKAAKAKLSAAAIIPVWIVLSSAVIIYNNHLYNTLQFKYPVFLVTWHLSFAVRFLTYRRRLISVGDRPLAL